MAERRPFQTTIEPQLVRMSPCERNVKRFARDMRGYYHAEFSDESALIYETYERDVPHVAGEIVENITVVYPGTLDGEYFMTKGHFHANSHCAEVYFCLAGEGRLLLEAANGDWDLLTMVPGTSAHVPPGWAHRSVNVTDSPLVIYALYPADAGHDYASIVQRGFSRRIFRDQNSRPKVVGA